MFFFSDFSIQGSRLVWLESKLTVGKRTAWGILSLALKVGAQKPSKNIILLKDL